MRVFFCDRGHAVIKVLTISRIVQVVFDVGIVAKKEEQTMNLGRGKKAGKCTTKMKY